MDEEVSPRPVALDMVYGLRNTGTRSGPTRNGKVDGGLVGAGLGGRGQAWEQWERRDCRGAVRPGADPTLSFPPFPLLFPSRTVHLLLSI